MPMLVCSSNFQGQLMAQSVTFSRSLAWLSQTIRSVTAATDLQRLQLEIARTTSAKHCVFIMRHVPGVLGDDPLIVETYSDTWRAHVEDHKLESVDPMRTLADTGQHAVDWAELPRTRPKTRKFFRDFAEFQLGRRALTGVFRGPAGDRSVLTLTSDVTDRRWLTAKTELAEAIATIHPLLHRAVLKTRFNFEGQPPVRLTPREKECLGWAAHGHTSKEIGESLGLTPATVNFFIDAAVGKLAAANRAHAAAKAVAIGLISPPR
jgi:DNA-binding CsgD family transcriptional regulator